MYASGRFYESVLRGNVYGITSVDIALLFGTALSTTPPAGSIWIYNPYGSGINVSVLMASTMILGLDAGVTGRIMLAGCYVQNQNAPTQGTALAIHNRLLQPSSGKVKAFIGTGTTLPNTPTILSNLAFSFNGTSNNYNVCNQWINGRIIMPPNTIVGITGITSGSGSGTNMLVWEELPQLID